MLFQKTHLAGGNGILKLYLTGFLFFFLEAVIGAIVELIKETLSKGRQIPCGPYIALSGILAIFFGQDLMNLYWGLF